MKKYILIKINKFLDWAIKKYGSDIKKNNEIIEVKNEINKRLKDDQN